MSKLKQTAEMMLCDYLKCGRDSLQYTIGQNPIKVIHFIDKLLSEKSFEDLANSGMQYLNDNHHPHTCIVINHDNAELLEGIRGVVKSVEK